ncbi:MAG: NTP transferase domain-containing protein [Chromatiales bacterium]|nr:MAG: NTP transferase domain-containing protein [Chromatiales bacterium]
MATAPLNGLVLAGGRSLRFGRDKAAVEVDGNPLLARTVALLTPFVQILRVSVRPEQRTEPLRAGFELLPDSLDNGGPAAGLLAAHDFAPDAAWLVTACDLPLLDADTLGRLVAARDEKRDATAYSSPVDGKPEPLCAIYEPAALARLAARAGTGGSLSPRDLLAAGDTALLQAERAEALANVNEPGDLERLQNRGLSE